MPEPGRVLVVEDDPLIRSVLETALGDEGYAVRGATHGKEALAVLAEWPADLILLDLMLPVVDGWAFLEQWRQLGVAPTARVIAVSASRRARLVDAAELGVAAVLAKPFDLEELIALVADLIPPSDGAAVR